MKRLVFSLLVFLAGSSVAFSQGPTYDELSSQMSRKEMEQMLERGLDSFVKDYQPAVQWTPESPVRLSDDVWVVGKGFYEEQTCRHAVFFYKADNGGYSPIIRLDMPEESVRTISSIDCGLPVTARIVFNRYGFIRSKASCPIGALISFFLADGCKPYVQIEDISEGKKITVALFMVNKECGYNHILKIDYPVSVLENRNGEVYVTMNCFVPTSNVNNLYSEKKKRK